MRSWIQMNVKVLVAELRGQGSQRLDLVYRNPSKSLVMGWHDHYQDNLLIPVIWIAKLAKSRHSNITLSWEIKNAFSLAVTETCNLVSMTNKILRQDGITLYYMGLNDFWVHERHREEGSLQFQDVDKIFRASFVGGVRSTAICSNCDSWTRIKLPIETREAPRGRCENPDFLDKVLSGPIFPEWNTKACGYFDCMDRDECIEIDFKDLESGMAEMSTAAVNQFFNAGEDK